MKARVARCDGAICFLVPIELKFHKLFSTISHCDINKSMKMIREIIIKEICSIHKKKQKKNVKAILAPLWAITKLPNVCIRVNMGIQRKS